MGITSLGKEWRYYKRQLDKDRREAKKIQERKKEAEMGSGHFARGGSSDFHGGSRGGGY